MNNKVIIIAEAGVNHNGDIILAKKLIEEAAHAGADYVKFQTFKAKNLATKNSEKANYQKNLTDQKETQFNMLKKLEDREFFGAAREMEDSLWYAQIKSRGPELKAMMESAAESSQLPMPFASQQAASHKHEPQKFADPRLGSLLGHGFRSL